jgi:methylmalonyl-CoA mutase N-terminal domain/subunit
LEQEAAGLMAAIDARGGAVAAVESGFTQLEIQESAYRAQQSIDAGETVVVGVNRFASDARIEDVFQLDPEVERRQIERVRQVRAGRSDAAWRAALASVDRAARDGANLVPPIIAAVEARATLGEIADALRQVFGEHHDVRGTS